MPLDPKIAEKLKRRAGQPAMHQLPLSDVRAGDLDRYRTSAPRTSVREVEDLTIRGPERALPVRIYWPNASEARPIIIYFHGGGFAICSIDTHDEICRRLCDAADSIVISVGYRLAPEHKFPAAPDDCLWATRWVHENASSLGALSDKMVVGGDSAGANLAAVTALRIRDEGGPPLCGQFMAYPSTDYFADTRSRRELATGYGFSLETLLWLRAFYLRHESDGRHPHVSPLRATTLAGLPPAFIATAEYDLLRDEGEAYGRRLAEHGVKTTMCRYQGMNHGFIFWAGEIETSTQAVSDIASWLRGIFL